MHRREHPSLDQLMAAVTAGSAADTGALVGGCAECRENLRWVRWVLDAARSDESVAPRPAVLERAIALFPSASPAVQPARRLLRRLLGELLFDSYRMPASGFTRGVPTARQLHYAVTDLALDIDLQLERDPLLHEHYWLTGQVLPAAAGAPDPLCSAVILRAVSGVEIPCTLYDTGEFTAESPGSGEQMLLIRVDGAEIALPIPGL